MPITPKPDKQKPKDLSVSEETIKAVINKGGAVPEPQKDEEDTELDDQNLKRVQLRLKSEWLQEIDDVRKKSSKFTVPSRHNWIVEAIAEKLEREKKNNRTEE